MTSLLEGEGFALIGASEARPVEHADFFRAWIKAGRHGEMAYLAKHMELRLDPGKLLPGARSVISVADPYVSTAEPASGPGLGKVARYATGRDYHKRIKTRLHRGIIMRNGEYAE